MTDKLNDKCGNGKSEEARPEDGRLHEAGVEESLGSLAEFAAILLRNMESSGNLDGTDSFDTVFSQSKQETYFHQDVAKALGKLRERMTNIDDTSVIIYPGSSSDETLARVFGPGVIHVDPDEHAMDVMREKGYNVAEMTIEEYVSNMPEEGRVDVVFSYNSGLVPQELLDKIPVGCYVIANNWHGSANSLGKNPRVTLVCAIDPESKSGEIINEEEAQAALGTTTTKSGNMNIDIEKNPNTLWLFRKNGEPSAKLQ
jgi:hypothetical protein